MTLNRLGTALLAMAALIVAMCAPAGAAGQQAPDVYYWYGTVSFTGSDTNVTVDGPTITTTIAVNGDVRPDPQTARSGGSLYRSTVTAYSESVTDPDCPEEVELSEVVTKDRAVELTFAGDQLSWQGTQLYGIPVHATSPCLDPQDFQVGTMPDELVTGCGPFTLPTVFQQGDHLRSQGTITHTCDTSGDEGSGWTDSASVTATVDLTGSTSPIAPPDDDCAAKFQTDSSGRVGDLSMTFDPAGSSEPDEALYTWDFGDGTSQTRSSPVAVTHVYTEPGEHYPTLVVEGEQCYDEVQKTVAVDPVTTYAPTVVLHPKETYFPGSVDQFLDHSKLEYRPRQVRFSRHAPKSCAPTTLAKRGQIRPARLSGDAGVKAYSTKRKTYSKLTGHCKAATKKMHSNDSYKLVTKNVALFGRTKLDKDDGMIVNLANSAAARQGAKPQAGSPVSAPLYYELRRDGDGSGFIVYWLFYPFNGWQSGLLTERHEGDWEHIVVRLSQGSLASSVAYYQHYCDAQIVRHNAVEVDPQSGVSWHPMVWAAKGGHASYRHNVGTVKSACAHLQGHGDKTGNGKHWRAWRSSTLVDARSRGWYGFGGSWGDRIEATINAYGPPGPGPKRSVAADAVPAAWRD
jgi:PKD repeat protein